MKNCTIITLFTLLIAAAGCQKEESFDKFEPIVEPRFYRIIERDTIISGNYLGMGINEEAGKVYAVIQSLQQTKGVSYLNVVSNNSSDITALRDRISLYDYILLDQNEGTDSGVQITLASGKIKNIYLNSGKELSQWPEKLAGKSAVRVADSATELYEKLVNISRLEPYNIKFQRISLLTKNLNTSFDPVMSQSPQWYFAYTTGPDSLEVVKMFIKNDKLDHIEIERLTN